MNKSEYEQRLRDYLFELMTTGEVTIDGNHYMWVGGCLVPECCMQQDTGVVHTHSTLKHFAKKQKKIIAPPASEGPGIHSLSDILLDLYEHKQEASDE